ncbi:MAG: IPExxxVDY family protein [Bacteroidales bacterium]|nr:IPExxxVDY family protein [Bacteroidales bacterium]MCF8404948.1 IPExxxVDY family protein [Bacteroidales bacterium]
MVAKKLKLDIDFGQNNLLIAISCHKKDYWLAFQLNHVFNSDFRRIKDLPYFSELHNEILYYPLFFNENNDQQIDFFLISNFNPDGKLFPSQGATDFFLLVQGIIGMERKTDLIKSIRQINGVLTAFEPNLSKLKNFRNFLSDLELHMLDHIRA